MRCVYVRNGDRPRRGSEGDGRGGSDHEDGGRRGGRRQYER